MKKLFLLNSPFNPLNIVGHLLSFHSCLAPPHLPSLLKATWSTTFELWCFCASSIYHCNVAIKVGVYLFLSTQRKNKHVV